MQELSNSQFLDHLRRQNVQIHVKDGSLQINAPAGVIDPQLRAELVRRKSDLLAVLRDAGASSFQIPLMPAERNGRIPQTDAQQGLWLINHFDPGNVAYNIPEAFLVDGPVDIEVLQKAVNELLARHETLRTYFYEEGGELFQSISLDAKTRVGFIDISLLAEYNRNPTKQNCDQILKKLMREQARRPFALHHPPLVRFHLFRLNRDQHVVFFNIHHIVSDRRSLNIVREELTAMYQAALRNESPSLPNLPVQYADYAIWVTKYLAEGALEKQIQYWKEKLVGIPDFLEFPDSRPCPAKRTPWGATTPVVIPGPLRDALNKIGHEEGVSLFMTLLAAFAVLLYRHTGSEDFCIGSPITHRKQVETQGIIGLFVNMLVFRCELAGEPTFREFLERTRNTALEAYENSDVPFQRLVKELKPGLRSPRSPLFQIMFGFDAYTPSGSDDALQLDTEPGTARYDLTLQLSDGPDGISGCFEYCTDLFDEPSIVQLARQFSSVLRGVVNNPDQSISSIEILPNAGCEQNAVPSMPAIDSSNLRSGPLKKFSRWLSHRPGNN